MYERVLFIGSKDTGLKLLKQLFGIAPDKIVGCITVDDSDDTRTVLNHFIHFCVQNHIEVEILKGRCDLTEAIERYQPDICFVMGWYYIIPQEVINKVKGGFIGIHNSFLPAYRGFAPIVWSIINGDNETGFSVFSFDKGMDTGDIWYQEKVTICQEDEIADVLHKISKGVYRFFGENYLKILSGELKAKSQSNEGISYGTKRAPEDGNIDWNMNASDIYNFVRAQTRPYPGAYTTYKGGKIIIWTAKKFPYTIYGSAGQIGLIDKYAKKVVAVCGENTGLILEHINVEGKDIKAIEYIKSLNYKLGE